MSVFVVCRPKLISVCPLTYLERHLQTSRNILHITVAVARPSSDDNAIMLCTSGSVDDVMFAHNGPHGDWRWRQRGRRAESSSQNFQRIRQAAPHSLTLS